MTTTAYPGPDSLFDLPVHGEPSPERRRALLDVLNGLTATHRIGCRDYDRILDLTSLSFESVWVAPAGSL